MEIEVALLKQELESQRRSLGELTKSQASQTEVIHSMDKKLDQVLANQLGIPERVTQLEMQEAQREGGKAALAAMAAASAAIGGLVGWLASLFGKPHS